MAVGTSQGEALLIDSRKGEAKGDLLGFGGLGFSFEGLGFRVRDLGFRI